MKKGMLPLWLTAILGFVFILAGAYIAISFFAVPWVFWAGVIMVIIGLVMIFVAAVLA